MFKVIFNCLIQKVYQYCNYLLRTLSKLISYELNRRTRLSGVYSGHDHNTFEIYLYRYKHRPA